MIKKLAVALVAVLAVTAVVASAASANQLYSGGSAVSAGTGISGSSIGNVVFKSGKSVVFECTGAELSGTVQNNGGSIVAITTEKAVFTGPGTGNKCLTSIGNAAVTIQSPACLQTNSGGVWHWGAGACNAARSELTMTLEYSSFSCKYRSNFYWNMSSPFNTSPLLLSTTGAEFKKESGSALCAAALNASATFELKTSAGGSLTLV